MKHFILYITLLLFITAYAKNKGATLIQEDNDTVTIGSEAYDTESYEYYNLDYAASCETVNDDGHELQTNDKQSNFKIKGSPMSNREDAYEEGRSFAEEDRLNGTRMHEGDDYDEDYDDDYDEGYDE